MACSGERALQATRAGRQKPEMGMSQHVEKTESGLAMWLECSERRSGEEARTERREGAAPVKTCLHGKNFGFYFKCTGSHCRFPSGGMTSGGLP